MDEYDEQYNSVTYNTSDMAYLSECVNAAIDVSDKYTMSEHDTTNTVFTPEEGKHAVHWMQDPWQQYDSDAINISLVCSKMHSQVEDSICNPSLLRIVMSLNGLIKYDL